jgi:hypothetical protein
MFSSEYAIESASYDGSGFSLFAPKEFVSLAGQEPNGKAVPGWLRVELGTSAGELRLVHLPQEAFGVGNFATVRMSQLRQMQPAT